MDSTDKKKGEKNLKKDLEQFSTHLTNKTPKNSDVAMCPLKTVPNNDEKHNDCCW